jgi:hypothetical protein
MINRSKNSASYNFGSFFKNYRWLLSLLVFASFFFLQNSAQGQTTYFSRLNGDWNATSTWSTTGIGGPAASSIPTASDFVIIGGGNTVTVTANVSISTVSFDAGLNVTNTLQVNTGVLLTVSGAITIPQALNSGSNTLSVGAGSVAASSLTFTSSVGGAGHQVSISTGTLSISGNITGSGTSSTLSFSGAGSAVIGGTLFSSTQGTLVNATGSTIEFNGANQNIPALTYRNVTLSGSGTKTLATGTTTISGNLVVATGVTFAIPDITLVVSGTSIIDGSISFSSTVGTKTFSGMVTVNGSWITTVAESFTIQGGITNNGTFTAGGGIYTFNTNSQVLNGILNIPRVTVTGVSLTNSNFLTISTVLAGTGTLVQGASATLSLAGTVTISAINASSTNNTVSYTGGNQTLAAGTYFNLNITGTGTKTLREQITNILGNFTTSGTHTITAVTGLTVSGNFSTGVGTTFNAGSFTHSIGGNFTKNGTLNAGTSSFVLNGTNQNITGANTSFGNLVLSGSGTKTFGLQATITGYFSIGNGVIVNLGGIVLHQANSLVLNGSLQSSTGTWGGTGSGATNINATFFATDGGRINILTGGNSYYSIASGDWDQPSTWSTGGFGGPMALTSPGAGDYVFVGDGFTVTVDANASATAIEFAPSNNLTNTLAINDGISLSVSDYVTIPQTSNGGTNQITIGNGQLTTNNLDFTATSSGAGHRITINNGTLQVNGNITGIGASSTLQVTGTGQITVSGAMFSASEGTLTMAAGSNFTYAGNVAQTLQNFTYQNVTFSGSGAKNSAATGTLTVNGNLTVSAGATVNISGLDLTVNGTSLIDGTINFTSTTGTKTFVGLLTVGGAWNATVAEAFTIRGGITNSGTFTANAGVYTFSTNAQALHGILSIPRITVTGITLTNNGTTTINTALAGTGTFAQGTGATLNLGGTSAITTLQATAANNTVNFTGVSAQSINAINYHNLGFSGAGTKTLSELTRTISGNLSITSSASITAVVGLSINGSVTISLGSSFVTGAFTHNVGGDFVNSGTFTASSNSQLNFNGTSQNISGAGTFSNLRFSGSGTKTLQTATIINGFLSIETGVVANLNSITTHQSNTLILAGDLQASAGSYGGTGSGATFVNSTFFSAGTGLLNVLAVGNTYYTRANGDWNSASTWSLAGIGGTPAASFPGASDIVVIGGGFTVTVTSNANASSISFDPGTSVTNQLNINGGVLLTVTDVITIPQTATSGSNILNVDAGTLSATNLDFTATPSGAGHQLRIGTGTATFSGNITGIGLSSTINFTGSGILQLAGSLFFTTEGTLINATGSRVEYNGNSNQSVRDLTYQNLIMSGTGTKTLSGAATSTINGDLTINNGATFVIPNVGVTVSGTTLVNGTLSITSATGTKTFIGAITVNGTWSNSGNSSIAVRNGITNTGTFTAGTGTYTFITNNQALTGDFNFARITVTGVTLTNNNNLTITTSLAGTGRLTQASGSVLTLSLTAAIGITNLTLNTNPNTVIYNAAGNQTVRAVNYHHLTLTGSGTKTFSLGAITVGGNLTTSGTVVVVPATNLSITGNLDIGNGTTFNGVATLNLAGNFIDNGVFNHNSGTLVLNGNNQNINGLSATTFHNLTAANAAGSVTKSVESSKNLVNVLTVGDNVTFDADGSANNAVFTLRSTGTVNSPDASIGPLLNGATVTGNVRVERNMGQEVNVWRYISTPVSGVGLTQFTDDMQAIRQSIRWYRESLVNQATRWTPLATNAELLVQGRGYHVWMYNNVPVNWDLTGPVYQGSFTWSTANGRLTSTTSTSNTDKDRWNLLGNPYPSPIVWDGNPTRWTIADPNLVATTVYVTDESTGVNFAFNFADGSGADGSGSVYPLLTDGVIARNQAFWVFVSPGASITIHEQAKVAGNQTGYNFFRENKPSVNQLTIAFGNDDIKDEAYFKLNQDATHNMDMRFDIPKLFNENFSIYFIDTFGQQMGMHTVPSLDGISVLPIGYKVAKEGEYSFNIRFKGSVEELQNWYLIDNLNKTAVAISEVIDLNVNIPAGILQSESRFALVKETSANYLDITVGPNPFEDELNIKANEPILSVEMFDLSGKSVFMHQPNEESKSIKLNATGLQSGILITKVKTTTGIYTKKLVKK